MRKTSFLALSFLLLALCSPNLLGQSSTSRIQNVTMHVKLRAPGGRPAGSGILVALSNNTGAEIARVMTDSRGQIDFENLTPAPYIVAIIQSGYVSRPMSIDMTYSPTQTIYLDLVPTKQEAGAIPPGGPADAISANVPASDEGKKALEAGKTALFEKKDAAAGLEEFKKLNKSDPDYVNGWVLTGTALSSLQKDDEAEKAFRTALKKAPNDYAANFGLGMVLNQQGHFEDAMKPLEKSLTANPKSIEALYELSRSNLALNRWQAAEPLTTQAIAIEPKFAPAHVSMGNIYLKKRDAVSALKEFETYLSLDPNGPFAPQTREIANKIKAALNIK